MNWIKFRVLTDSQDDTVEIIHVPKRLANELGDVKKLRFGTREMKVAIKIKEISTDAIGKTFHEPMTFFCTAGILEALLIKKELTYQLVRKGELLDIGPVIGLLLGEQQYYYHDKFMGEFKDAMCEYSKVGGLFIAFKTCSINWDEECIFGMFYNFQLDKWCYGKFPIPSVVYLRAFNVSSEVVEKLRVVTDGKIFNPRRMNKWLMYKRLRSNPGLKKFLPETKRLIKLETFRYFLGKYDKTILKPIGLSRGRGICVISKISKNQWLVHDYTKSETVLAEAIITEDELEEFIESNDFIEKNYLIQPYLNLAKINGNPWDIRIVMQKDRKMQWRCNGIECRVAGSGDLVTNISRGGRALPISVAVNLSFGPNIVPTKVKHDIIAISKELCESLDREAEPFAEFGIDIAMDVDQNYWIIESNVRPTYNGFKKHMDYKNYLHLCTAPIFYATALAGFEKERKS